MAAILLIMGLAGPYHLLICGMTAAVCLVLALWVRSVLGGLTGDTFGFLTELGDILFLLILFCVVRDTMPF